MLTINIKKKIETLDDIYNVYIGILETMTPLKFAPQERIVMVELLKDRIVTKEFKEDLKKKVKRVDNILTSFRKKGIIKDNIISPRFQRFTQDDLQIHITLKNG